MSGRCQVQQRGHLYRGPGADDDKDELLETSIPGAVSRLQGARIILQEEG